MPSAASTLAPEVAVPADAQRADPIHCDARQNGLSAHSMPAARAELGNLRAMTRLFRPTSQQYGIGDKELGEPPSRSRSATAAGRRLSGHAVTSVVPWEP